MGRASRTPSRRPEARGRTLRRIDLPESLVTPRPDPAHSSLAAPDPTLAVLRPPRGLVRWMRGLALALGRWRAAALITLMAMVLAVAFTALVRTLIGATESDFLRGLAIAAVVAMIISPMCSLQWLSLLEYQMQLEQGYRTLAMGDVLTGVPNRRWIIDKGERAVVLDGRSVLVIDVDRFRVVNERYGHRIGDAVLRHVAQVLSGQLRRGEFIGRFGGEEFLVLTSDASSGTLTEHAERLRIAVAAAPLKHEGEVVSVTVSIGAAVMSADGAPNGFHHAIREADVALSTAKRRGRNRVHVASPRRWAGDPNAPRRVMTAPRDGMERRRAA